MPHTGRLGALLAAALLVAACQGAGPVSTPTSLPKPSPTTAPPAAAPQGAAGGAAVAKRWPAPPPMTVSADKTYTAVLETTKGTMTAELFVKEAPLTVNNFVFLAREGYYDGVPFHRVIKGFMVQTGDPTGTGTGGPGYRFNDEPVRRDYTRGTLAMANAGPHTNGSQFFIVHQDYPLPKNYTIFGQVVDGLDTLDKIASTPVRRHPQTGENSVPTEDLRITRITIREAPAR